MKFQIFKKKLTATEYVFLGIFLFVKIFTLVKILPTIDLSLISLLTLFSLLWVFVLLFFLAWKDFESMEVDQKVSLFLIVFLLLLNVSLFFLKGSSWGLEITEKFFYFPYENLIGAVILGLIFQLIVLLTKEKGLGQGDVRIAIICGLLIGSSNLILWLYITVFTALIFGLILAYKKRKFKGLKIPFVPFMVLGSIVTILLSL